MLLIDDGQWGEFQQVTSHPQKDLPPVHPPKDQPFDEQDAGAEEQGLIRLASPGKPAASEVTRQGLANETRE
jgi:hypothetical protein